MEKQKVIIIMTDDDKGLWSIYDESGGAVEHDFESEGEAMQFADDNNMKPIKYFNEKLSEERRKKLYPNSPDVSHLIKPKKEFRLYVVDVDDLESDTELPGNDKFDEELFMQKAEDCGKVFTLKSFQSAFNNKEVNTEYELMLIKEVIVHE